ncbi:hypothetical protein GGS21DRAFT_385984 [Xylaria nigripes]|nr:hypothetical protein GGS21DRAFT_385984 [Xylaria nigripes]
MTDQDMRLRLVVRRNGLPELRLMWNVRLGGNPTISKLLEQLNDYVPLESGNWGLEDYVVELHDNDGTDFECLHYQLVKNVLRVDDRVFIRALDRDDHRRRRVSGRVQISSDGRHLIDGVPFGRPLLKGPISRPAVCIPPRKRLRLAYKQRDDDSSILFLTNGKKPKDKNRKPHTQSTAGHSIVNTNPDDDDDDDDFTDHDVEPSSSSDEWYLEDGGRGEGDEMTAEDGDSIYSGREDSDHECEMGARDEKEGENSEDLEEEARDLAIDNSGLEENETPKVRTANRDALDKSLALRAAFPMAPVGVCERVLAASNGNIMTTFDALSEGFTPQVSREAVISWKPKNSNCVDPERSLAPIDSTATRKTHNTPTTRKRKLGERSPGEDSQIDEIDGLNDSLLRKYDHAGFPPGTITSGKGLAHMARISTSFGGSKACGNSEITPTTLKASEGGSKEDDDGNTSSSSGSSSSTSSGSGDESERAGEEDLSSELSSSQSSSNDSSDSDSESIDDQRQGPTENDDSGSSSSPSESDTSDSGSDSGPEERPFGVTSRGSSAVTNNGPIQSSESSADTSDSGSVQTNSSFVSSSLGSSSSGSSTSGSSKSASEKENSDTHLEQVFNTAAPTKDASRPCPRKTTQNSVAPRPVPPGAGKESTKRRNARRRAANLAKMKMRMSHDYNTSITNTADVPTENHTHVADEEAALFAAKRKALLSALGIESIGAGSEEETTIDDSFQTTDRVKRKRSERDDNLENHDDEVVVGAANASPCGDEPTSPLTLKRRRIDLGASRRLVFGALGLRNPKTKEDEQRLRNQIQNDAPVNGFQPTGSNSQSRTNEFVTANNGQDPNAWKLKINYRAVECCHDDIELRPAPFPFKQRWDPQQQYASSAKSRKRGGQNKQTQRSHPQYYNDEKRFGQKEYCDVSSENMNKVYDDTCDAEADYASNANITLNYDDIEEDQEDNAPINETSLTTDLDDLPSLPKDISTLPTLRPGEAQVGMVIAWQKWSCSSATSWRPQLSWVTAIVIRVEDDAAALELCLARRDRYLDRIKKRYDGRTGQRIYDRFEAPDLHEGDDSTDSGGVDDGYRSVFWADLQDPRILQQPLEQNTEYDIDSQAISSRETDATVIHTQPVRTSEVEVSTNNSKTSIPSEGELEDASTEFRAGVASDPSTFHKVGQGQHVADFTPSGISQRSSPSRQLLETTSQAAISSPPSVPHRQVDSLLLDAFDSIPLPTPVSSHPRQGKHFESDVIAGTPKVIPCQPIRFSTGSVRSERQVVPASDLRVQLSNPFDNTDQHNCDIRLPSPLQLPSSQFPSVSRKTSVPGSNEMGEDDATRRYQISRSSSSSSLPSLNSIWCAAQTSQHDPSQSRMSLLSSGSKHEEGIPTPKPTQDVDNRGNQFSSQITDSIRVKTEILTQPLTRTRSSRPFSMPPNTQVIELSSDSEPAYMEDYADDDVDGTYTPERYGLPKGEGWVKKRQDGKRHKGKGITC